MSDKPTATITLKGSGKDAPWIVLNGEVDDMVQTIAQLFEFPEEQMAGLAPVELMLNADTTLKALSTAGEILGGKVIASETKPDKGWSGEQHEDAWDAVTRSIGFAPAQSPSEPENASENGSQAASEPEPATEPEPEPEAPAAPHPYQHVLDELQAQTTTKALQAVWTKEQKGGYPGHVPGAFKNDDVIAMYKKVGTPLKEAGK